jgi:integrase
VNPAIGTAPKQSRVKQSRPELRFLTEREFETAVRLAGASGDLLSVTVGTGLRFGEVGALWVGDVISTAHRPGQQGVEAQRRGRRH